MDFATKLESEYENLTLKLFFLGIWIVSVNAICVNSSLNCGSNLTVENLISMGLCVGDSIRLYKLLNNL